MKYQINSTVERLHNLDYLRGIAAAAIMIYHYLHFDGNHFNSEMLLGRLGLYGVSIFYILSGVTLHYVYVDKFQFSFDGAKDFFKKRALRILPLLWIATIGSIVINRIDANLWDIFLNLTGLFGLFKWDAYYAVGAWSIGNELVFYLIFPFALFFLKKYKPLFYLLLTASFLISIYYAFVIVKNHIDSADFWSFYVNPLNQAYLFLSGMLIGHLFKGKKVNQLINTILLIVACALFVLYPTNGESNVLILDYNRIIFSAISILIVTAFLKLNIQLPNIIHIPLVFLGHISYSLYLLHPIVYNVMKSIINKIGLGTEFITPISIVVSIISSFVVYKYFESYFVRLGKKQTYVPSVVLK